MNTTVVSSQEGALMDENLQVYFVGAYQKVGDIKKNHSPEEIRKLFLEDKQLMAGELLTYAGYTKHSEDDKDLWEEVCAECDSLAMIADDAEGNIHIFNRDGNDYFTYGETIEQFRASNNR